MAVSVKSVVVKTAPNKTKILKRLKSINFSDCGRKSENLERIQQTNGEQANMHRNVPGMESKMKPCCCDVVIQLCEIIKANVNKIR